MLCQIQNYFPEPLLVDNMVYLAATTGFDSVPATYFVRVKTATGNDSHFSG